MSTMKIDMTEIINELGGDLAVAYQLNVHQQTVKRWMNSNFLPQKYWLKLASMLPQKEITYRDFARHHKDNQSKRA